VLLKSSTSLQKNILFVLENSFIVYHLFDTQPKEEIIILNIMVPSARRQKPVSYADYCIPCPDSFPSVRTWSSRRVVCSKSKKRTDACGMGRGCLLANSFSHNSYQAWN